MSYSIRIRNGVRRELAQSPREARERVIAGVDAPEEQPLAGSPLKGGLRGLRRQRVGDHRVRYELLDDELGILVVRVARRRDLHRRR